MVGLEVSFVFWVFLGVLPLFSVFLLFWCPCILPVYLGTPLRLLMLFIFLPIKKKIFWCLTSLSQAFVVPALGQCRDLLTWVLCTFGYLHEHFLEHSSHFCLTLNSSFYDRLVMRSSLSEYNLNPS